MSTLTETRWGFVATTEQTNAAGRTYLVGHRSGCSASKQTPVAVDFDEYDAWPCPSCIAIEKKPAKTMGVSVDAPEQRARPSTGNAKPKGEITWSKQSGEWALRVPSIVGAHSGDKVTVHKKDGSTVEAILGIRLAIDSDGVSFYEAAKAEPKAKVAATPETKIPDGFYAVTADAGHTSFYKITNGRKPGVIFVNQCIGGGYDEAPKMQSVPMVSRKAVFAKITADGIEESSLRYGTSMGRCCRCNRSLTEEESRRLGIGPECRKR